MIGYLIFSLFPGLSVSGTAAMFPPNRNHPGFPIAENTSAQRASPVKSPSKKPGSEPLKIASRSAYALDRNSGTVIYEKDASRRYPIASITKLMTALTFLDYRIDWEKEYTIEKSDRREGGRIFLYEGEQAKVKDLFYASLVGSGNSETIALVRSSGADERGFVERMNAKAAMLGLGNTVFKDPIGLDAANQSTAREVARIAQAALGRPEIARATLTGSYSFTTGGGRKVVVATTDRLLDSLKGSGLRLLGGKTGYIDEAGYCFVGRFSSDSLKDEEIVSVVLGAPDIRARFAESSAIARWGFENYEW